MPFHAYPRNAATLGGTALISHNHDGHQLRILCIGLEEQEQKIVHNLVQEHHAALKVASSDMDLTEIARVETFDLYVIGQTEKNPDTDYLIWLLKDYAEHSRFVLLYNSLPPDREHRLEDFHAYSVLHRPLDLNQLHETLEDAITGAS